MKKGEIPQLDSKWWEKNKAKTLLKTGIGETLRVYEAKMDKFDYAGAITALNLLKTKAADAAKKCNDTLHGETKDALNKYPKVIETAVKDLQSKQKEEEEKKKKKDEDVVPPQKMGNPEVLWSKPIGKSFFNKYKDKLPWLKSLEGGEMELIVNSDIQKILIQNKQQVIAQRMVDSANKLFDGVLEVAFKKVESSTTADSGKVAELEKVLGGLFKATQPKFLEIPKKEFEKFKADKKQYKDYQIKVACNAGITTLKAIGTGITLAAAVPTGGATLAFAIIGAINTVADAAKQIRDAAQEAEGVLKRLVKNLAQMNDEFTDTKKKALAKAKEVGKTVANTILNFPIFPTVKNCGEDCELASDKTSGLAVKHVALGGDVTDALDKLEALDKVLAKAKSNPEIGKVQKKVIQVRGVLNKALDTCADMGKRVTDCEELCEKVEEMLKEVQKGAGEWIRIFETVFPAIYNLALAGANAGVGFADAKSIMETSKVALDLTNDIATVVKDQVG